jgi:hypothetical protein
MSYRKRKEKNLNFVSLIVSTWKTEQEQKKEREREKREESGLVCENIHPYDCLKKYVYVLADVSNGFFCIRKMWLMGCESLSSTMTTTNSGRISTDMYVETYFYTNSRIMSFRSTNRLIQSLVIIKCQRV